MKILSLRYIFLLQKKRLSLTIKLLKRNYIVIINNTEQFLILSKLSDLYKKFLRNNY